MPSRGNDYIFSFSRSGRCDQSRKISLKFGGASGPQILNTRSPLSTISGIQREIEYLSFILSSTYCYF